MFNYNTVNVWMKVFNIVFFMLFSNFFLVLGQDQDRQVRNIQAFGKMAGYIQYFSASDANHSVLGDWDYIYINGVQTVRNCKDDQELLDSLRKIFEPLEPALEFIFQGDLQHNHLVGKNLEKGPLKIFKQNIGLQLYSGRTRFGQSIRVNRRTSFKQQMDIHLIDTVLTNVRDVEFVADMKSNQNFDILCFEDNLKILERKYGGNDSIFRFRLENVRNGRVEIKFKIDNDLNLALSNYYVKGVPEASQDEVKKDMITNNNGHDYTFALQGIDQPLYEDKLDISDTLHTAITDEISISLPLCLYGDSVNTYPISTLTNYPYIKVSKDDYYENTGILYPEVQVANLLMIWNVFRFSFAYLTLDENKHQKLLEEVIKNCLDAQTVESYVDNVWYMLRAYGDSHIFFNLGYINDDTAYTIPVDLKVVNNKFHVKDVFNDSIRSCINIGDEVLAINNIPISNILNEKLARTTGSDHNRFLVAMDRLLDGPKDSEVILNVKRIGSEVSKDILFERNEKAIWNLPGNSGYLTRNNGYVDSNLYYFDLTRHLFDEVLLNKVAESCPNIIIDMRGYLEESDYDKMVRNLIKDSVNVQRLWTPHIISPMLIKWRSGIERHSPVGGPLSKANIFFLADASTQSAPETLLELMKYYKVGTVIGGNTSGANGTVNYLMLPGNMFVTFSGQIFKNSDGSQHHRIGIIPDIRIEYTLEDIINREDPYINKIKELIK